MRRLKSRDGSLTFQTGIPKDHPPEEGEEDHRRTLRDHLQAEEVEEVVVAVEEPSCCLDTRLPNQLKSF